MQNLSVLIGENDAGKSSILDILEIVLNGAKPDENDFFNALYDELNSDNSHESDTICVTLTFKPDSWDLAQVDNYLANDGLIYVQWVYSVNDYQIAYKTQVFEDEELNSNLSNKSVGELDTLINRLNIDKPEGRINKDERLKLISDYMSSAKRKEAWVEVKYRDIRPLLPTFQRYRAIDYTRPESIITKTLQAIFESMIFENNDDEQVPIESLRELTNKVDAKINRKANELVSHVKYYYPRIQDIQIDTNLDFRKGFAVGEFLIDDGRGFHRLSKVGDGTKRRILMATLDWDQQTVETELSGQTIIRAYDEPDSNLHYEAQRKMFAAIQNVTEYESDQDYRVQGIVCTHSLVMIDRAPAKSLNHLKLSDRGITAIETLQTDVDDEVEQFLDTIARELGISNTVLFYERCYLIIEGETEENALPLLYRTLYGTSLIDDGIRLINLKGHGAWLSLLKLLGRNRQHITISLLDTDAREENEKKFIEAGFDRERLEEKCFWLGDKEFEDSFSNSVICMCLNELYPRIDKTSWDAEQIENIRRTARSSNRSRDKFSEKLRAIVNEDTHGGTTFSKAEFGYSIGKKCASEDIPETIKTVLVRVRSLAEILDST